MNQGVTALPKRSFVAPDDWSVVTAIGPDAQAFLQAFCTNDLLRLSDNDACEAMFTDVKAHVIAYTWVIRRTEEDFLILLSSSNASGLVEHLDRYLIRERVELQAATDQRVFLVESPPPTTPCVARLPVLGESTHVALASESTLSKLTESLDSSGYAHLSLTDFQRTRIRCGVPLDRIDVDARNLPQEVDRNQQAISFTKGCYLGQEPVARIDALGRVNWLLRGLQSSGPPPAREAQLSLAEKSVGRVTSSVSVDAGAIALGYVRREHAEDGTSLNCESGAVTVRSLPMRS